MLQKCSWLYIMTLKARFVKKKNFQIFRICTKIVRFGLNASQIGAKWAEPKCTEIWSEKVRICPIWGQSDPFWALIWQACFVDGQTGAMTNRKNLAFLHAELRRASSTRGLRIVGHSHHWHFRLQYKLIKWQDYH